MQQPNYAPWCGYFAKMLSADAFVFLDDAQLPQGRSYVSRVKIAQGRDGEQWLTVPGATVHLYGKGLPRPGRKMGHVTEVLPASKK